MTSSTQSGPSVGSAQVILGEPRRLPGACLALSGPGLWWPLGPTGRFVVEQWGRLVAVDLLADRLHWSAPLPSGYGVCGATEGGVFAHGPSRQVIHFDTTTGSATILSDHLRSIRQVGHDCVVGLLTSNAPRPSALPRGLVLLPSSVDPSGTGYTSGDHVAWRTDVFDRGGRGGHMCWGAEGRVLGAGPGFFAAHEGGQVVFRRASDGAPLRAMPDPSNAVYVLSEGDFRASRSVLILVNRRFPFAGGDAVVYTGSAGSKHDFAIGFSGHPIFTDSEMILMTEGEYGPETTVQAWSLFEPGVVRELGVRVGSSPRLLVTGMHLFICGSNGIFALDGAPVAAQATEPS